MSRGNVCARVSHGLPKRLIRLSNNRKIDCRPIVGAKSVFPPLFSFIYTIQFAVFFLLFFYTHRFFSTFYSPVRHFLRPIRSIIIVRAATFFPRLGALHTGGIPKRPRLRVARVVLFKDSCTRRTTFYQRAHTAYIYFVFPKTLQSEYTIGPASLMIQNPISTLPFRPVSVRG